MKQHPNQPKTFIVGMYVGGLAVLLMMLLTVVDVILKNLFNSAIPGNYLYIQNYLMPIAIFCGIPYALYSGIFPRLDMLINRWKHSTRLKVVVAILIIEVISFIIILYYSFLYGVFGATTNITFLAGINSLPLYPMFFLVSLSFGLPSYYLIRTIISCVREKKEPAFFAEAE
ncbi:TRAP transporter small permease [Oceanobacillus alkalisoli]|uniref:TRAP transporter small permease n=1 Tax=Oceanobacillus alkalisoli TaxID=2925113 RepID=UPI001F120BBF|nr:TRAP transporter small permease [Oceanobacillus alkalisoli]MCF3944145.1 TRAP transporter small permease [Oceanobacillus alkalisoli]